MKRDQREDRRPTSALRFSKQERLTDEDLKRHPPARTSPRLEKGLNKRDRVKFGWTTYMQRGRATI